MIDISQLRFEEVRPNSSCAHLNTAFPHCALPFHVHARLPPRSGQLVFMF
jgi:hypothetical protein